MEQIAIALTGVVAIWLSQDRRDNWRKFACLFGMADHFDWTGIEERKGKMLCSQCAPSKFTDGSDTGLGVWHGRFKRKILPLGVFKTNREGNLEHVENGATDYNFYIVEEKMNLFGEVSDEELYIQNVSQPLSAKVEQSIAWISKYESLALQISELGYYVAFSGGKDSVVLKRLFQIAGVKHHCWYNNVTIDPPELIYFIKKFHNDVGWNNPKKHLISAMLDGANGPPTRINRWCCKQYKESGGNGFFKATGVRAEESPRRKETWSFLTSHRETGDPIQCPIIYWTDWDIWTFIKQQGIPYCSLYDEGFERLGCIGCPQAGPKAIAKAFKRWPRYERLWKKGFEAYWKKYKGVPRKNGEPRAIEAFSTVENMWAWWISGESYNGDNDCQSFLW